MDRGLQMVRERLEASQPKAPGTKGGGTAEETTGSKTPSAVVSSGGGDHAFRTYSEAWDRCVVLTV